MVWSDGYSVVALRVVVRINAEDLIVSPRKPSVKRNARKCSRLPIANLFAICRRNRLFPNSLMRVFMWPPNQVF